MPAGSFFGDVSRVCAAAWGAIKHVRCLFWPSPTVAALGGASRLADGHSALPLTAVASFRALLKPLSETQWLLLAEATLGVASLAAFSASGCAGLLPAPRRGPCEPARHLHQRCEHRQWGEVARQVRYLACMSISTWHQFCIVLRTCNSESRWGLDTIHLQQSPFINLRPLGNPTGAWQCMPWQGNAGVKKR